MPLGRFSWRDGVGAVRCNAPRIPVAHGSAQRHHAHAPVDDMIMYVFIRFLAIALTWMFFLVGAEAFLDARGVDAGRLLFLVLPLYAGIVIFVLRLTRKSKD